MAIYYVCCVSPTNGWTMSFSSEAQMFVSSFAATLHQCCTSLACKCFTTGRSRDARVAALRFCRKLVSDGLCAMF